MKKKNIFSRDKFLEVIQEGCLARVAMDSDDECIALDLMDCGFHQTLFTDEELEEIWNNSLEVVDLKTNDSDGQVYCVVELDRENLWNNYLESLYEKGYEPCN